MGGPIWTLLMGKAEPLVNSLEARLYMRLLPCSNIVICNVWPLGLFENKAFLIEARYRPSCLILLICIDIAILIEETAKNYLSSLLLETNLSAAIEKIFWKKKIRKKCHYRNKSNETLTKPLKNPYQPTNKIS